MNFLGNIEAKLDSKGRFFMPMPFRKLLQENAEERMILKKDLYQTCLVLYPESIWNNELQELKSRLNKWDPKHQLILRQYVSDVEILSIDINGRMLIPKRYLEMASIQNDIRFIGMDDKIEVWAKNLTDQPFMHPKDFSEALKNVMNNENNYE